MVFYTILLIGVFFEIFMRIRSYVLSLIQKHFDVNLKFKIVKFKTMIDALQTRVFNFQKSIINCYFFSLKVLKIDYVGECVFALY